MALETNRLLDNTGWRLIQALQQNARLSYSELGNQVGLSAPAVADRIRRMGDAGIITGYHAEVNMAKLGIPVSAIVHLGKIGGHSCQNTAAEVSEIPEVVECYRVTETDSIIVRVVATSVDHLANVIDQLSQYGIPSASIVRSKPIKRRMVMPEVLRWEADQESNR